MVHDDDSEEYNLREVQRKAEYACSKAAHHLASPPPCPATIGCGARGCDRLARLEVDLLDMGFQAGAVRVAIARHGNDKER